MNANEIIDISWAHPLVREWFLNKFGSPTEPQLLGWPAILTGKTTLISAPTGSGKTFAAFLACLDKLIRQALDDTLEDKTEVLYISPLKALSNDVQKNLTEPLKEITALAEERGFTMAEIRVAVRTGDTLAKERQKMLKNPPHILVTTPESFYILLTAEKSRSFLTTIQTVIIDEIHAMADDKRGAHLALSLERLEELTPKPPLRIGLSATQKPIEMVAGFLTGNIRPPPIIINIGHIRQLDLEVEVPPSELGAVASNELWDELYDRLTQLALAHRSTLIFVNTRRLAERVAHHLGERLGEDQVAAHHGSLSRKIRLHAETKLKNGELKALVATASLELGIDIGSIDLVCQLNSPRSIAVGLQRVGRAGHWRGAISKGRFFATTRDDLLELAALIYAIRQGDLDQLIMPEQPLDILTQQIVAICATGEWQENELFALVKRAYPYRDLERSTFDTIIRMLSEGIAGSRGRYGTYLYRDQVHSVVKGRKNSRLVAITSGGAIPDNGLFTVVVEPEGVMVGTLDEDFAVESNAGDIILLGSTSWQIKRVESSSGRVLVEDAHGAPPSVPFWRGEAPARTKELSFYVAELRQQISDRLENCPAIAIKGELEKNPQVMQTMAWLHSACGVDELGALQLIEYILQGKAVLGEVPTQKTLIAERFFDEGGGMQLVIHAPLGARINKAWGLALRKKFCRSFNFELQAAATDNGINIALAEQHSFPLADVFKFLHPNSIKDVLTQAVLQSPLFPTRWRWDASRALALVRFRNGKKVPPQIQRMLADDLLAAVFPDAAACQDNLGGRDVELPDHPLINETMKDALHEALDLDGLIQLLQDLLEGKIKTLAVDTPLPSVFSHEILNANPYAFLDDAPLEERRARAVEMRRVLPDSVLEGCGNLDPLAIDEVQQQAWLDIRNADDAHDALQTLIAFPVGFTLRRMDWDQFIPELMQSGRVGLANVEAKQFWVAAEKSELFTSLYPQTNWQKLPARVVQAIISREEALIQMLRGWLLHLGPTNAQELAQLLSLSASDVEQTLVALESTGLILRGNFTGKSGLEWCERRLLARIHRLTIGRLRREIAPVTAGQFYRWLLQWQHVAGTSQLRGEHGVFEIIRQLQGFEIPANAWEKQILAKRVSDYHGGMLDRLCLSGTIGWGRFSPHPATLVAEDAPSRRITPSSVVPITFFVREEAYGMFAESSPPRDCSKLSKIAQDIVAYLEKRGASFFADLVRDTGHLKAEIENGLWELVATGFVTADGFDNLRALIDPRRRSGKSGYRARPRFSSGRWTLLSMPGTTEDKSKHLEAICWMLLRRYGLVFRDLLVRESMLPRWRELLVVFRRLEDRGEIRGGRFVYGFLGEQFSLPYVVESLRASAKTSTEQEHVNLSAVDPLNLQGIILPGEKVSAISGKMIEVG